GDGNVVFRIESSRSTEDCVDHQHRIGVRNYRLNLKPLLAALVRNTTIAERAPCAVLGSDLGHQDVMCLGISRSRMASKAPSLMIVSIFFIQLFDPVLCQRPWRSARAVQA